MMRNQALHQLHQLPANASWTIHKNFLVVKIDNELQMYDLNAIEKNQLPLQPIQGMVDKPPFMNSAESFRGKSQLKEQNLGHEVIAKVMHSSDPILK